MSFETYFRPLSSISCIVWLEMNLGQRVQVKK